MSNDPYAALGVKKSASDSEIKKAYRKIARESHPDLNPDDAKAEARFKAASAAFDFLKDNDQRAKFDRGEIDATGAERAQHQYYRDFADASENPYRPESRFDDTVDPADIFAEFLRQGRTNTAGQSQHYDFNAPGPDHRYKLEVTFLDAVNGAKTRIKLPDGSSIEVKIPRGAHDGQTLRLRGKGGAGIGQGPPGNALVTLSVRSDPTFRRDGNDILMIHPIAIDVAVLGGKVAVPTIDGTVNLSIPKGANGGRVLRLRGRGVKPAKGASGDQMVELRIIMPMDIDPELSNFMEKWREDHAYDPANGGRK